jgi:hypothetical protein
LFSESNEQNLKTKKISIMKTINDFKTLLFNGEKNTLLGYHLNNLFGEKNAELKAYILNFEEKVEVIAQMHKNGINVFEDNFVLGNVTKAFYQYKLTEYAEY